ncbi:AAA family ATPase [Shouchella patagoniensis]|uniref:AAA family ATPase n=1 Tax=Shouchella patagoniensis TaxID=228576 RepID=UPI0009949458|nr:AAA family ATPase [Shouchella patagoniensis]
MFLKRITIQHDQIDTYGRYPFSIPFVRKTERIDLSKGVTFLVGENGSGKSTMLEAIADKCGFHTAGGSRNNVYDVHESASALGDYVRLSWLPKITNGFFLRAESFYQFATHIDEVALEDGKPEQVYASYGGKSLHHQSHGESFLSLFTNRFRKKAIYLLDEPEAALSPQRQLAFLRILHDLTVQGDTQFIIATHSPILLGFPKADIFSFDGDKIKKTDYEDTDHYQVISYFINNREKLLRELFKDDSP